MFFAVLAPSADMTTGSRRSLRRVFTHEKRLTDLRGGTAERAVGLFRPPKTTGTFQPSFGRMERSVVRSSPGQRCPEVVRELASSPGWYHQSESHWAKANHWKSAFSLRGLIQEIRQNRTHSGYSLRAVIRHLERQFRGGAYRGGTDVNGSIVLYGLQVAADWVLSHQRVHHSRLMRNEEALALL